MVPSAGSPDLNIGLLAQLQAKPAPFSPGGERFWTDPHIAGQMLAAHLDPNTDAASRRPETIQRSVAWIIETLGLRAGDTVLDLGCGPGLYAARLAARGLQVTGVDFSENSLRYAVEHARQQGLSITYRCQNYLEIQDESSYSAVLLIYGDFCVLTPEQRACLLFKIRRALKPGGSFVLDVTTPHSPGPVGSGPVAPAAQSAPPPVSWDPGAAPDQAMVTNIKAIVLLIDSGDVSSLAGRVGANGLIIAPYAVGTPDRGLTGDAAANALRAMLTGATPHVSAYAVPQPGRVDLIVTGLNPVQIAPAVGEALTITSPAQVSLFSDEQGNWQLGIVAADAGGLLNQSMGQFPFRPWPPAQ